MSSARGRVAARRNGRGRDEAKLRLGTAQPEGCARVYLAVKRRWALPLLRFSWDPGGTADGPQSVLSGKWDG